MEVYNEDGVREGKEKNCNTNVHGIWKFVSERTGNGRESIILQI